MSLKVTIGDGKGTNNEVKVTSRGQLVTAPLEFSDAYFTNLDVIDTPYNFIIPKTGKRFVITAIVASGNKFIGTDGALVSIYEANSADTLIADKEIFGLPIPKNGQLSITPLNIIITEGTYVNASVDDDDVYLTITGYYIEA